MIAPHWAPIDEVRGYVRYLRGGSAPNRWFVMEWNRVRSNYEEVDEYTFEAILYESGDIVFQYGTMISRDYYWCQASGIEDSSGLNGLAITPFCNTVAGNHAVRITRPGQAARGAVASGHGPVRNGRRHLAVRGDSPQHGRAGRRHLRPDGELALADGRRPSRWRHAR